MGRRHAAAREQHLRRACLRSGQRAQPRLRRSARVPAARRLPRAAAGVDARRRRRRGAEQEGHRTAGEGAARASARSAESPADMKRAIVVGSGPSGSTVARLLAKSGKYHVVILEKGRNYFTGLGGPTHKVGNLFSNDEIGWESRRSPIRQDPFLEPRSFRTGPGAGKRTHVGEVNSLPTTVGGGTIHYDAKARRFREVDFITNTLFGGTPDKPAIPGTTYADWAMEYRHIEPFYAVMEEIVGVQGPARRVGRRIVNPNPYESWRSTPFAMPPGVAQLNSLLPSDAAKRLGYHPAPVPTSINSRPYRGRPACVDCGFCLSYGCPSNAKGGGVWQLQDAL
ncbi:MAG: GMC family oxidoreductase, partial [Actinobacteria bacterium]